jgi:nitroreductase
MIKDLIIRNRSYRRFYQKEAIGADVMLDMIDCARNSASAANLQPLRYLITDNDTTNRTVFSCLRWAGYLSDWQGPEEGEKPSGYIVILGIRGHEKNSHYDAGIAVQSMLLKAVETGWGGCIFAAIDRERLARELGIPKKMEILLVLALGKPKEKVILHDIDEQDDIRYWRDQEGVHHVPKRRLKDIVIRIDS